MGKDIPSVIAYLGTGEVLGDAKEAALEWLAREEAKVAAAESELRVRSTAAAEEAATAARRSAKWAGWALFVSIAALAIAAWPHVVERLK